MSKRTNLGCLLFSRIKSHSAIFSSQMGLSYLADVKVGSHVFFLGP